MYVGNVTTDKNYIVNIYFVKLIQMQENRTEQNRKKKKNREQTPCTEMNSDRETKQQFFTN